MEDKTGFRDALQLLVRACASMDEEIDGRDRAERERDEANKHRIYWHTLRLQEQGRWERAEKALRACAEKFREYERLHLAKRIPGLGLDSVPPASREKANANAAMAEMCEAALTLETPEGKE